MPFVTDQILQRAADGLKGRPPLAVVTFPALLKAAREQGVDPIVGDGPQFGGPYETALLDLAFRLPRPPDPRKPFRAVWDAGESLWVRDDYAGSGLQRTRKDRANTGVILRQTKVDGGPDHWALDPNAGQQLYDEWSKKSPDACSVRMIDLAIWFGRDRGVMDLNELLAWFKSEYNIDQGDLVGTIYIDGVPKDYAFLPLSTNCLSGEDYEKFGSLPVAPTLEGSLSDLAAELEARLDDVHFVSPPGLTIRVLSAWVRGDIVVLVGQPGTGKTMFATEVTDAIARTLGIEPPVLLPVREDFDESEMIGYEQLNGEPLYRDFTSSVVLTDRPLEPHVVVLEEFNLAVIERYLSSVLTATQEKDRRIRLPGGSEHRLPVDTFIIATCNSFRDEPETRTRLSMPTKRRATIITMPNILSLEVDALPGGVSDPGFDGVVKKHVLQQIEIERIKVAARIKSGQATTFDAIREEALSTVMVETDVSAGAMSLLCETARAVLGTPEGRAWFTLALLRDIAMSLALAPRDESAEVDAVVSAIIDKVVHQLRGPHTNADSLLAVLKGTARYREASDLVQQMKSADVPSELLPLI